MANCEGAVNFVLFDGGMWIDMNKIFVCIYFCKNTKYLSDIDVDVGLPVVNAKSSLASDRWLMFNGRWILLGFFSKFCTLNFVTLASWLISNSAPVHWVRPGNCFLYCNIYRFVCATSETFHFTINTEYMHKWGLRLLLNNTRSACMSDDRKQWPHQILR